MLTHALGRPALLLALVAATAHAHADTDSSPSAALSDWTLAEAVVHVHAQQTLFNSLNSLLDSPAAIGSIAPDTVLVRGPETSTFMDALRRGVEDAAPVTSDKVLVQVETISNQLVALSAASTSPDRASKTLQAIEGMMRKVCDEDQASRDRADQEREIKMDEVRRHLSELRSKLAEVRSQAGGLDPEAWANVLRQQLMQARTRQFTLRQSLSVSRTLGVYLGERAAAISPAFEHEGDPRPNPEFVQLERDVAGLHVEIRNVSDQLTTRNANELKEWEEAQDRMRTLQSSLLDLEQRMSLTPATIPGPLATSPNPEFTRAQQQLLSHERHVAEETAELEAHDMTLETIARELSEYERLSFTSEQIQDEIQEGRNRLSQLRAIWGQRQQQGGLQGKSSIEWISGPTIRK